MRPKYVPTLDELRRVVLVKRIRRMEPEIGFADIKRLTGHTMDRDERRGQVAA